jgi:hypothetical protein
MCVHYVERIRVGQQVSYNPEVRFFMSVCRVELIVTMDVKIWVQSVFRSWLRHVRDHCEVAVNNYHRKLGIILMQVPDQVCLPDTANADFYLHRMFVSSFSGSTQCRH